MLESNNIKVKSYSKLNLYLKVLDKRPDGFHNINSVFQSVDLFDELTFTLKPGVSGIEIKSENPFVPKGETNLVVKAYNEIMKVVEQTADYGVICEIKKNIPIGSGLGGGSSNCAASLVALNQLLKTGLEYNQLMEIGTRLGSDVPYFFIGGTTFVHGRGEHVESIAQFNRGVFLIVSPLIRISTADAYKHLDDYRADKGILNDPDYDYRETRETMNQLILNGGFEACIYNDFEIPILEKYPEVKIVRDKLEKITPTVIMTGSGASVFGYFQDYSTAWEELEKFDKSEKEIINIVSPVREGFVIYG